MRIRGINEKHWTEYYATHERQGPSEFAKYVSGRLRGNFLFDFGCGDGRDTLFLDAFVPTMGIDPCAPPGMWYFRQASAEDFMVVQPSTPDTITYARWFLHAVHEHTEDRLLEWTKGQLLVEARVEGDDVNNDHWRRPLNAKRFLEKLLRLRYDIRYFEISRNFSPPGSPLLLRVDALRKGGESIQG